MGKTFKTIINLVLIFIQITGNSSENISKNESEGQSISDRKTDMLLENPCKDQGTCDNNVGKDLPVCYCDEACHAFNDCCLEVIQTTNDQNSLQELRSKTAFASCEKTHLKNLNIGQGYSGGSYFISKCPTNYPSQELFQKCDNGDLFPVNTNDGITYKNVYCAYCHGNSDYTVWEFHFMYQRDCNPDALMAFNDSKIYSTIKFIQNRGCVYYFVPPSVKDVRFCWLYFEAETSDTLKQTLCEEFPNAVRHGSKYYRNIFCLETIKDKRLACVNGLTFTGARGIESIKLTRIFSVRPAVEISGQKLCNDDEYYNDFTDSCLSKSCSKTEDDDDNDNDNDKCNTEFTKNFSWKTNKVSLITDVVVNKELVTRAVIFFYISLPHERYDLSPLGVRGKFVCGKRSTDSDGGCCMFDGFAEFAMRKAQTPRNIDDFVRKSERMEWKYSEVIQGKTVKARPFKTDNINNTCIVNGTIFTDERYQISGMNFNVRKKSFVYDDSDRSKIEVPISFEGTAFINGDGGEAEKVEIKRWKFRYKSDGGATSGAVSLNEWSAAAIMIYVTMLISCVSVLQLLAYRA